MDLSESDWVIGVATTPCGIVARSNSLVLIIVLQRRFIIIIIIG